MTMKILLSGYHNPHFETVTEYTEAAITELGHRLYTFDDRDFRLPGAVRDWWGALQRWDLRKLNRRLVSLASIHRPDVCLVQGGHRILPETIRAITAMGSVTVLWTVDAPGSSGLPFDTAPLYDLVFCGGTEAIELLTAAGVAHARWLPFGCPSTIEPYTLSEETRLANVSDVCFVGSYYPNRARLFEQLSDFSLLIRGPGWDRLPRHSPLAAVARGQQVLPAEWRRLYAASKIVLGVHYQDGRTPCHQASPRVFEVMACGAFLLCDAQRDVTTLFKDGEHLVLFHDAHDLRQKLAHYLSCPGERTRIAERGRREALKNHTYAKRVEQLLTLVRTEQARSIQ
jgi:spore maturation protein CgeB